MSLDPATHAVYETHAAAWAAARQGKPVEAAERLADRHDPGHGPLLDLGCGPGILTAALPAGTIGLDPALAMLDLLKKEVDAAIPVAAEAAHLPFRTRSLGGALVNAVYVHVDRPLLPLALAELHRVVAVGGPIELGMFGGDQDLADDGGDAFAGRRYALWDDRHLLDVLEGAGFSIVQHARHDTDHWPYLRTSAVRERSLADTIGPDMRLLVCGLNPSLHSADLGVGFGRAGNRFWPAALAAGLVTVDRDARHALLTHGVGMTDLVKRATPRADQLTTEEYRHGIDRLARMCGWLRPAAVCMVGLAGWRAAVDRRAVAGWQPEPIGGVPVYVMPSTSGLNAHARLDDLTEHLRTAAAGYDG